MNIFYLDRDPEIAAQMMCDKHVVKMILESAQMLSTAHRVLDGDEIADSNGLYKMAHKNHPSTIWVRANLKTYDWLYQHMDALMKEYTFRYGKHHATERLSQYLCNRPKNITHGDFTDPPQCMPDLCKDTDTVLAYQNYYILEKSSFAKWKSRSIPKWFNGGNDGILGT
jgi:hypothetical protein|tara:strand:- start:182 stop:688 length:507 start_codon:yes stop_codon:yes gene_type:complete